MNFSYVNYLLLNVKGAQNQFDVRKIKQRNGHSRLCD